MLNAVWHLTVPLFPLKALGHSSTAINTSSETLYSHLILNPEAGENQNVGNIADVLKQLPQYSSVVGTAQDLSQQVQNQNLCAGVQV